MAISVSGGIVKSGEMTRSWGLTPGSADLTLVGLSNPVTPGTTASFSFGAASFVGVVHDSRIMEDDGRSVSVKLVDNRIRMMWDTVYCSFNEIEVVEDDLTTPGIDRKKRYVHLLPDNWQNGVKTYTDEPYTAKEIIIFLAQAPTVKFTWSMETHARLDLPGPYVDADGGKKFGNVFQEICDSVGLQFTLINENQVLFSVKGEGIAPSPSTLNSTDRQEGEALGPETRVRIVGDRNLRQVLNVELSPDWNSHYEAYWYQPEWVKRVKAVFEIVEEAEAVARAREVTMREYIKASKVTGAEDYGAWYEVSRMDIPVWIYITDIVWKAYKLPSVYKENGGVIREGLLAEVEGDAATGVLSFVEDGQLYPEEKAFVLAQGQPLDFKDPKVLESLNHEALALTWKSINRFGLDAKNHVVIFEDPIFKISTEDDEGMFLKPNEEIEGAPKVVVPNAGVVVTPASVKGSFCFEAERFSQWFGDGNRDTSLYMSGLNRHLLMETASSPGEEITYGDGETAAEKAEEAADAFLTGQDLLQSGGFTRHGVAGMSLNGAIDRISVTVAFTSGGEGEGLSEQITYAKERSPLSYESERELQRRAGLGEMGKKIKELNKEAKEIRLINKLTKANKRNIDAPYKALADVVNFVVGNIHCSPVVARQVSVVDLLVGSPIRLDDSGSVSDGGVFRGVVVAANSPPGEGMGIILATKGYAPVRAKAEFEVDETINVDGSTGIISQLMGCDAQTSSSSTKVINFSISSPIKKGDLLYQYGTQNYVTSFDFVHLAQQVFQDIIEEILSAVNEMLELDVTFPSVGLISISGLTASLTHNFSFPNLNIVFPPIVFEEFDECDPLVSGFEGMLDALENWDTSKVFDNALEVISEIVKTITGALNGGVIDDSAFMSELINSVDALLCQIAAVVDTVILNIDKILKFTVELLDIYLNRQPVGVAMEDWLEGEDVILLPVDLDNNRGGVFVHIINSLVDMTLTVVRDIVALSVSPVKLIFDFISPLVQASLQMIENTFDASKAGINLVMTRLMNALQAAFEGIAGSATQIVNMIKLIHENSKATMIQFAEQNKLVVTAMDLILRKSVRDTSNAIVQYLNKPWVASPTIYFAESPFDLDLMTADPDWCEIVSNLDGNLGKIISASAPSLVSFINSSQLFLNGSGNADNQTLDLNLSQLTNNEGGKIQFREMKICENEEGDPEYIMVACSAPYTK